MNKLVYLLFSLMFLIAAGGIVTALDDFDIMVPPVFKADPTSKSFNIFYPYYDNMFINQGNLSINGSLCFWNSSSAAFDDCGSSFNFTGNVTGVGANRSYFFNNTVATHDGNLGGYSGGDALCAAEFAGTHLCGLQELLDTVHDKALPAAWTGYAWYSTGGSKYLSGKPTDDCHGWTSNSATDYLGSFWVFGAGYTDAYGSTVNCGELKSLACCKAW